MSDYDDECNAGIAGGCGACEKCDPAWWLDLANEEIARLNAALDDALNLRRSGIALIDIMRRRYGREARQWEAHHDQRMRERDAALKDVERLRGLNRALEDENLKYHRDETPTRRENRLLKAERDTLKAEVERLTKNLKDQTFETYLECSAQQGLQEEIQRLTKENEALSKVYVAAARLRMFPVPFDDHWELVGAVDECKGVLEPEDDSP